jgi:Flp pilus assembly protein TadD
MTTCRILALLLCWATFGQAAESIAVREAVEALRRGDFAVAEQKLRTELRTHPGDGSVLSLLAVALDSQNKAKEAEPLHRKALAGAPNSPDVLNNYANHLLSLKDDDGARKLYLRTVAAAPTNYNANVQLARMAIRRHSGAEALGYLKRLPETDAQNLAPIRLAALYLAGERADADTLARQLSAAGRSDLGLNFSTGILLADAGEFDKAAKFLNQALVLAPADFNVISNLAVVSSHAGDHPRARDLLETALSQQPDNVEVLYLLAHEEQALHQSEAAVGHLARAAKLAPDRPDVQKLLALATSDLGALEDAATAWDRYRKLAPNDDTARRERAYIALQMGQFEQALAELQWFVTRHPDDPVGHYELGVAESKDDGEKGLAHFDKALSLKPDFLPALMARGSLYYQLGKPEAALADLQAVNTSQPGDAVNLDRLGQTYLALDRPADAVKVLRKAAELAPEDGKTQLHFARALADAGQTAESKVVMDRFRQLGPPLNKAVPGGLVDYLSLTPEQRHADYRARLERLVHDHPNDPAAQVSYLKLLLDDGKTEEAARTARRLVDLKPSAALLTDAGRALLEAAQYSPAGQLLELAAAGQDAGVAVDLAIAAFHSKGAAEGLRQLDRIPEAERNGDSYLARALILEAAGHSDDASAALEAALQGTPRRVELYRQAVGFLVEKKQGASALRLIQHAERILPQERELSLMRATVLEITGQSAEAEQLLGTLQNRWPEWSAVWVAHGIALAAHGRFDDGRRTLETAAALGAHSPEMRACLANTAQRSVDEAPNLLRRLLQRNPRDW